MWNRSIPNECYSFTACKIGFNYSSFPTWFIDTHNVVKKCSCLYNINRWIQTAVQLSLTAMLLVLKQEFQFCMMDCWCVHVLYHSYYMHSTCISISVSLY